MNVAREAMPPIEPAGAAGASRLKDALVRVSPAIGQYALAALLTLALVAGVMRLWRGDLRTPIIYDRDALLEETWLKCIVDHGWYLHNPNLAAPDGQSLEDFPQIELVNFLIVKSLAIFTRDVALVFNLFVLSAFMLTTISSLAVLRHFGVAYPPALACSLLYSLSPYHFARLEGGHAILACYQIVPYSLLVAMWIYQGRLPWPLRPAPGGAGHATWR